MERGKKYKFVLVDADALRKQAKNAVETIHRPITPQITKLLDAGVTVAGIQVTEGPEGFLDDYVQWEKSADVRGAQ